MNTLPSWPLTVSPGRPTTRLTSCRSSGGARGGRSKTTTSPIGRPTRTGRTACRPPPGPARSAGSRAGSAPSSRTECSRTRPRTGAVSPPRLRRRARTPACAPAGGAGWEVAGCPAGGAGPRRRGRQERSERQASRARQGRQGSPARQESRARQGSPARQGRRTVSRRSPGPSAVRRSWPGCGRADQVGPCRTVRPRPQSSG